MRKYRNCSDKTISVMLKVGVYKTVTISVLMFVVVYEQLKKVEQDLLEKQR